MRDLCGLPQPTSEAHRSGFAISKLRFRLRLRLHGVAHNTPSPMADLRRRLVAAAVGCGGGFAAAGDGGIPMRKGGEFGIFFVIL